MVSMAGTKPELTVVSPALLIRQVERETKAGERPPVAAGQHWPCCGTAWWSSKVGIEPVVRRRAAVVVRRKVERREVHIFFPKPLNTLKVVVSWDSRQVW